MCVCVCVCVCVCAVASLRLNPASSLFNLIIIKKIRLLRQMSTKCSSAKTLSFWREQRSHSPSDAGIMTD